MEITRKILRKTRIMEQIITFLPGQLPGEPVFQIEMTGITYPDSHYHIERENSSIYILEYIMEGEGLLRIGEETYRPAKGDVYLLPRGKSHFYQARCGQSMEKNMDECKRKPVRHPCGRLRPGGDGSFPGLPGLSFIPGVPSCL